MRGNSESRLAATTCSTPAERSRSFVRCRRYGVEGLERRLLFAAVSWDGGGNGSSWTDRAQKTRAQKT
jgi:hypothetical protein